MNALRAVLVLALLALGARAGGRLARAEYELVGPLARVELETEAGDRVKLAGELSAGERRRVVLAVPGPERAASVKDRAEPRARWAQDDEVARGRVRFLRWLPDADDGLEELPPGLRARSRPPVARDRAAAGLAAACVLAATLAGLFAARRRAAWVLAVGATGGVLAAFVVRGSASALASARVVEGEFGTERWLRVHASAEALILAADELEAPGRLVVDPPTARLEVEQGLASGCVTVRSARARLFWSSWTDAVPTLAFAGNRWRDLELVHARRAGEWSTLGPWKCGAERPAGTPGTPAEGWLLAGLPQGVDVLLARVRDPDGVVWVRLTE
ncbi:MAG: hypothetical protein HZA53_07670 [Planctomycetes bacterium]|nr:hypothetical protein [Planctomycetota bacterium]